ncbi:MAG: hypothetical protein FWD62_09540 [Betaproteobacteria bacterium]|nr:hypothetical protein [Betaproteobacteria bacterium]
MRFEKKTHTALFEKGNAPTILVMVGQPTTCLKTRKRKTNIGGRIAIHAEQLAHFQNPSCCVVNAMAYISLSKRCVTRDGKFCFASANVFCQAENISATRHHFKQKMKCCAEMYNRQTFCERGSVSKTHFSIRLKPVQNLSREPSSVGAGIYK